VKQAGSSLTEIVGSVKKVADLVSEIAVASQEQASGVDQVSRAVSNMDEMTQQNAALVQETNASLHSARNQIDALRDAINAFSIGSHVKAFAQTPASKTMGEKNPVRAQHGLIESKLKSNRMASPARRVASASQPAWSTDKDWQEF
jgi:methyl-accepting chemotaxis protein